MVFSGKRRSIIISWRLNIQEMADVAYGHIGLLDRYAAFGRQSSGG